MKRKLQESDKPSGPPGIPPQPEKYSAELWERPRQELGLKLIGEEAMEGLQWQYVLSDDNRRSFAAFHACPFNQETTQEFFCTVRDEVNWLQPEGPNGPIPRKTAWFVAPGCTCSYRYGSIEVPPQEYPPWMITLMSQVMPFFGYNDLQEWPNACNVNLYEDGGMSVGWHSDDERIFQGKFQDVRILSLSLGARRKFELRINWPEQNERPIRTMMLGDGDLCTMEGMTQKHFQHRVPKEGGSHGPRINLTWRWAVKHAPRCPAGRPRRGNHLASLPALPPAPRRPAPAPLPTAGFPAGLPGVTGLPAQLPIGLQPAGVPGVTMGLTPDLTAGLQMGLTPEMAAGLQMGQMPQMDPMGQMGQMDHMAQLAQMAQSQLMGQMEPMAPMEPMGQMDPMAQMGQMDPMAQMGQMEQMGQTGPMGQMEPMGQMAQPPMEQVGQMEQMGQMAQPQMGQMEQMGQMAQPEQLGQMDQMGQMAQPEQMGQMAPPEQMGQMEQMGQTGLPPELAAAGIPNGLEGLPNGASN